jgi:hypothetical protein
MTNIIEPQLDYDFSKLQLGIPASYLNSTYIARIFENNKPIYIQTPKCNTRGGIVKSGKKMYCDLMFSTDDSIFIDWISNLEAKCQTLICNKSESWFQTTYSKDEIETAFSSSLKIFKAGKFYLMRVNIKPTMKIYTDLNVEVSFDDINENTKMLNIIEFYGIKFTSRYFQIEVELKQSMIVGKDEFVENCFIKPPPHVVQQQQIQAPVQAVQAPVVQAPVVQAPVVQVVVEEEPKQEKPKYQPTEPTEPYVSRNVVEIKDSDPEINNINTPTSLELSEFNFDDMVEHLEETTTPLLRLKRPTEQYYKEYNDIIFRANKLKEELTRAYLEARTLKEKYELNVDDIDKTIYSDIEISDNESNEEEDV